MSYEPPGGAPPPPPPGWRPLPPSPPYPASTYPGGSYAYTPTTPTQSTKGVATALTILLAAASIAAVFVVYAFLHRASVVDDLNNATFQDISDWSGVGHRPRHRAATERRGCDGSASRHRQGRARRRRHLGR